jgi:hypothetical protein
MPISAIAADPQGNGEQRADWDAECRLPTGIFALVAVPPAPLVQPLKALESRQAPPPSLPTPSASFFKSNLPRCGRSRDSRGNLPRVLVLCQRNVAGRRSARLTVSQKNSGLANGQSVNTRSYEGSQSLRPRSLEKAGVTYACGRRGSNTVHRGAVLWGQLPGSSRKIP